MTFEFETDEPKVFVDERIRAIFDMIEDMKSGLRDYNEAELQEIKECARAWKRVSMSNTVSSFAYYIIDRCNYQMSILRAAQTATAQAEEKPISWLDRPEPKEYR